MTKLELLLSLHQVRPGVWSFKIAGIILGYRICAIFPQAYLQPSCAILPYCHILITMILDCNYCNRAILVCDVIANFLSYQDATRPNTRNEIMDKITMPLRRSLADSSGPNGHT